MIFQNLEDLPSPIEFDHGYLVLVHEVVYSDEHYYLHRFLHFDKDFNIRKKYQNHSHLCIRGLSFVVE